MLLVPSQQPKQVSEPGEFLEDGGEGAVAAIVVVLVAVELVVFNFEHVDFLALDVRARGGGVAGGTAEAGEGFGFLDVLPGEDDLGFFDGVGNLATRRRLDAVAYGVFAGPLQSLGCFAAFAAVVQRFEPAGGNN